MYLQFALVTLLALSGLVSSSPDTPRSSPIQSRSVDQVVADVTPATLNGTDSPGGASPEGVSIEEIDIVVPPVQPSDQVVAPEDALVTQADPDVVVADQLVAPARVESEVVEAAGFQTVGVTWPGEAEVGDLGGQVRTRTDGEWSEWVDLRPGDGAPDAGTADAENEVRGGTESVWIGDTDAVQLAFAATAEGGPAGLSLALIGSERAPAPDGVIGSSAGGEATIRTSASATGLAQAAAAPRVISRGEWGAPAQICTPDIASKLVGAVVHHTAGSNSYTSVAGAMDQIRNDANFHIGKGWCDIGYNFIVDKWGNIYEGRAGSLTQAVIGVHAGGFNTGTVGVSMLGTYDTAPSVAAQEAVARIIGWRLGSYGIDPRGSMTYYTGSGTNSRYLNTNVNLPRVFGHRDTAYTACPGQGGWNTLPSIRAMAWDASYADRFTQARPVVTALYADLLLRGVDPEGLRNWSALLAGGASQSALVSSLTGSVEYNHLRIRRAYVEVLGREPEPGGVAGWNREILAGRATADDVKRRFYDTQEYYNISGGTPAGYIEMLYRTAFERSAGAGESAYWSGQIAAIGRTAVVNGIWLSLEAAKYRAAKYYQTFLKRAADQGGQEYWARVLLAGGEGAVRAGIAGSEEYRVLAGTRFP